MALISFGSAITLSPGETQATVPEIAKGDPVTIAGNATGQAPNGLTIWIVGDNYARTYTVPVRGDQTYLSTLKADDTARLAEGQYLVVVQTPGQNGRFDIVYHADSGSVVNIQPAWMQVTYRAGSLVLGPEDQNTVDAGADTVVTYPVEGGTKIYQLINTSSSATNAGTTLMNALTAQNVDDTFSSTSFSIADPDTFISPIPNHAAGDQFTIRGNTNLAVGDMLAVEITSLSSRSGTTQPAGSVPGSSGSVTVVPGTGEFNCWTYTVDTTGFKPDKYTVRVSGPLQSAKDSATFTLVDHLSATDATNSSVTTAEPGTPQQTGSAAPVPTTQKSPLLPVTGICGLAAALMLRTGRRH